MAKTTAPLLSFGGSGQIAKTQVYSTWKGVAYARRYVIPSNPNTSGQQSTRNTFQYCSAFIKLATAATVEVWTAFTKGKPLTVRNGFMSANIKALRGQANNDAIVLSNGAAGGLPVVAAALTKVGMVITATCTAPTLPTGWTVVDTIAVATLQQDPEAYTDATSYEGTDATAGYAPQVTVPAAGTYVVAAWMKFNKGTVSAPIYAYGPAVTSTIVV